MPLVAESAAQLPRRLLDRRLPSTLLPVLATLLRLLATRWRARSMSAAAFLARTRDLAGGVRPPARSGAAKLMNSSWAVSHATDSACCN